MTKTKVGHSITGPEMKAAVELASELHYDIADVQIELRAHRSGARGMSHIPFDQIVDRVRELDTALYETQVQINSLWLAGLGAAVRETGDDGEVISVLAAPS